MSANNLNEWLDAIGLAQYAEVFEKNAVDLEVLPELSEQDLAELGIPLGHRKRLLKALRESLERDGVPAPHLTNENSDQREEQEGAGAGERRQLTVMFCDLVGSTALSEKLDPEELRSLLHNYRTVCGEVIARYEGFVARYVGDGILTYFGWPTAHEDDAERSIRAALDIVSTIQKISNAEKLSVRIGIATGPVVIGAQTGEGDQSKLAIGSTPNLAARLQGLASADQIVIALSTRHLTGNAFELADLGEHTLKGISEPIHAWRVQRAAASEGRFEATRGNVGLTPFVGREEEIGLLLARWQQAHDGEGQIVLLCGEPGIGKSRISQTLRERLADEPHTRLSYQCSPYHINSAFYPIITQLERAAGFGRDDGPDTKLNKLEAILNLESDQFPNVAPLIAALLSLPIDRYPPRMLSPQKQKELTMAALADQVIRLSRKCPVLMLVEDVHWIDPSTMELLNLMPERVRGALVLMLLTHRPEFASPWPGQEHVTAFNLNRLPRRLGLTLVENVTGGKTLPPEVLEQILAKTDGVPLFVEELTRNILESGYLTETEGRYELKGPLPALAIPSSLQDSLMARLDRLGSSKEIAQIGACIGREFGHDLLVIVSPHLVANLEQALQRLLGSGLILKRGTAADITYSFKHALVQDVAYDSLLKSRRQAIHQQLGEILEQHFASKITQQPELAARHFTAAGIHEKAFTYWLAAGQVALVRFAAPEAIGYLESALDALSRLPVTNRRDQHEIQVRRMLGRAYVLKNGWAAESAYEASLPALDIAHRLNDVDEILGSLLAKVIYHNLRDEFALALAQINQMHDLAKDKANNTFAMYAFQAEAHVRLSMSEFRSAQHCDQQAMPLYDPDKHRDYVYRYDHEPRCAMLVWAGWRLWALGYPDQARQAAVEQLDISRQIGHVWNLIWALQGGTGALLWRGEYETARNWNLESRALATTHGLDFARLCSAPFWGAPALIGMGQYEAGYAEIVEADRRWRDTGALNLLTWTVAERAKALAGLGRLQEALVAIQESLDHSARTGQRIVEAEAFRLKGEFLLLGEKREFGPAELAFNQCLEVARAQEAKSFELRGAMSLARLWQSQGKHKEALELLKPVYNWFTEGFDTKDLIEAKALLEELAR